MKRKLFFSFALILFSFQAAFAQNPPAVTIQLNEQFLNSFLDAVFTNLETPTFQLSKKQRKQKMLQNLQPTAFAANDKGQMTKDKKQQCAQSVTLLREMNGVRTGIKFEDGKILAPLAFTGNYDIPLVGCTAFKGWAEANLNLEYDAAKQILFGRVKVNKVDLNGVPGIASGIVARMVQGTIDRRINPVEILKAEQVSAIVPVQYAKGSIRLRATNMQPEVVGNSLNVRIAFEFAKAN